MGDGYMTKMSETIGSRIRTKIIASGMSQREFAKRIGTTDVSISRYIKGTRTPKASVAAKMAEVLGCSANYLLGIDETETNSEKDFYKAMYLIARSSAEWNNKQKSEIINALFQLDKSGRMKNHEKRIHDKSAEV